MASVRSRRVKESQEILAAFGLPAEQRNERAALTLLALLDLLLSNPWHTATNPLKGVTPIMDFVARNYRKKWAPNTRETVRRFTLHQFEQAGLVIANPDEPRRPTNSPKYCYQVESRALVLVKKFDTEEWGLALRQYLVNVHTLARQYEQIRDMRRIPLELASGETVRLSPGGQNVVHSENSRRVLPAIYARREACICRRYGQEVGLFRSGLFGRLGVATEEHGKIPDVEAAFPEAKLARSDRSCDKSRSRESQVLSGIEEALPTQ